MPLDASFLAENVRISAAANRWKNGMLSECCCSARRGPIFAAQISAAAVPVSLAASTSESLARDLFGPRRVGWSGEGEPLIPGSSRSLARSRAISRFAERRRRSHWAAQSTASIGASAVRTGVGDSSTGRAVQ